MQPSLSLGTITDEEMKTGDPQETLRRASMQPIQIAEGTGITTRQQRKRVSLEPHQGPGTPEVGFWVLLQHCAQVRPSSPRTKGSLPSLPFSFPHFPFSFPLSKGLTHGWELLGREASGPELGRGAGCTS